MSAAVLVRDAHARDRATVRDLTLRAYEEYAGTMTPSAWEALRQALESALASDAPAHRIVAERHGAVIGSVMLFPPATDAYGGAVAETAWPELRLLAVAPAARGLGVARMLVNECVRRARAEGAKAIGLHTSVSMQAAIRLYAAMGFTRDAKRDFQPEGAELVEGYVLTL